MPPSMRVFRTALAFVPAPPETVALSTATVGYLALYSLTRASRAGPSSPDHQEKISSLPAAEAPTLRHSLAAAPEAALPSRPLTVLSPARTE